MTANSPEAGSMPPTRTGQAPRGQRAAALLLGALLFLDGLWWPGAGASAQRAAPCAGRLGVAREVTLGPGLLGPDGYLSLGLGPGEVVLSFDDGPSESGTLPVLRALAEECVAATFLLLGSQAERLGPLVRRILAAGHTVGSHTRLHQRLPDLPLPEATADIAQGRAAVEQAMAPARTTLFRFPFLADSRELLDWMRGQDLLPLGVDLAGDDWTGTSPEEVAGTVMARLAERRRGVILLHDTLPGAPEATRLLLRRLKAEGYRIVHLRG